MIFENKHLRFIWEKSNGCLIFSCLLFCLVMISCNSSSENNAVKTDSSLNQKGDTSQSANGIQSKSEEMLGGKPISFWLQSPEISDGAKEILKAGADVNLNTKDSAWSICDSMLLAKKENRVVYFYAVTRTLKLADGAYPETAGDHCKQLMETDVLSFCHYFSTEPMLKVSDVELWSDEVFAEICLENEGKEKAAVMELSNKMQFYQKDMNPGERSYSDLFLSDMMNSEAKFLGPKK
jgi:hypothetical protein